MVELEEKEESIGDAEVWKMCVELLLGLGQEIFSIPENVWELSEMNRFEAERTNETDPVKYASYQNQSKGEENI